MKQNILVAKMLRKNMTNTERKLWKYLRGKRLNSIKFKRQEPIGKYIVDFISYKKKIIIELDGGQHAKNEKDIERDKFLKGQGYKIIRIWNNEVLNNIEGVIETIIEKCEE